MRLIGLAGWSGSGKTSLLAKLLPVLIARGHNVSTVKHAHHAFEIDKPGKDSHTHRLAGAHEVLVSGARRWALMHELRDEPEPTLAALSAPLARRSRHCRRVQVRESSEDRSASQRGGKPLLYPDDPNIRASRCPANSNASIPSVDLNDIEAIADLIDRFAQPFHHDLDLAHRDGRRPSGRPRACGRTFGSVRRREGRGAARWPAAAAMGGGSAPENLRKRGDQRAGGHRGGSRR